MWFRPESTDSRQFVKGIWRMARWMLYGPFLGALILLGVGLLAGASPDSLPYAMLWGAGFGLIAGVMVTGNNLLARWKV